MPTTNPPLPDPDWISLAAHALAHRWGHVPVAQLDEVAAELHRDESLREMPPADAVALWLKPLESGPGIRESFADRLVA